MRTMLKHSQCEETLILRELSKDFNYTCRLCNRARFPSSDEESSYGEIYRVVYCCEDYDFVVHKWCAEFPQQIHHPYHPQHPLTLDFGEYFIYKCQNNKCGAQLDAKSAIATLPPTDPEDEDTDAQVIEHFAHEHPLSFFCVKIPSAVDRQVCKDKILGSAYGCRACLFIMHESCAKLPRDIENHPLHPEHIINLVVGYGQELSSRRYYAMCGAYHSDSKYRCLKCEEFALDVKCALSYMPASPEALKLQHWSHGHQLTPGYLKGGHNKIFCGICGLVIKSGQVYSCTKYRYCSFSVHKNCAELPTELIHPYHPQHALTLKTLENYNHCYACGTQRGNQDYVFNCEICNFNIDVSCAIETRNATLGEKATSSTLQHFARPDLVFTLCYVNEVETGHHVDCTACKQRVEGLAYYQQDCYEWVHASCIAQLKPVLRHPFHPQHPLILLPKNTNSEEEFVFCNGCHETCVDDLRQDHYYYSCACGFHLDLKCALRRPTLKDSCHRHDLAYFEYARYQRCDACGYNCSSDLYRCVECNFNVHFDCLPLPPVVEDVKCHFHPLTLCDKLVLDVDEDHCDKPNSSRDVCGLGMNPSHGVYHCKRCPFVAHIECVISKEPEEGMKPKHSHRLMSEIFTEREREEWYKNKLLRVQKRVNQIMQRRKALESLESIWTFKGKENDSIEKGKNEEYHDYSSDSC